MKKYMRILTLKNLSLAALFAIASIIPAKASAATVFIDASRTAVSVGDTAVLSVKIDSEGDVLNTVNGEVDLKSTKGTLTVQEFSLANSAFGLWPRTPSLSQDGHAITFTGGVPGGFKIDGATLFKVVVQATKEGVISVAPQNMSVYLNDGKGTKVAVQVKGISITVGPKKANAPATNDWAGIVSGDITPPGDFAIVFGQDPTMYSGKKFAYFSAVDNQSGIDHYEVSENGTAAVRTGSTYVLQNQTGTVSLVVTAFDKAGNKKIISSTGGTQENKAGFAWGPFVIALVLIVAVFFLIKSMRRNKHKKSAGKDL